MLKHQQSIVNPEMFCFLKQGQLLLLMTIGLLVRRSLKYDNIDEETNVQLTGVVDEILQRKDGSYFIVDYKTARFTANQDILLPVYKVQLNGYALIAEKCGLKPVTGIGLVYYEPQTNVTSDSLDLVLLDKGFHLPFKAHLLELELNPQ